MTRHGARPTVERFAVAGSVLGALVLTGIATGSLQGDERAGDQARLDGSVASFATVLRVELERLADAGVDAGVAVALAPELDRDGYGELLGLFEIQERFPGVLGVTLVERVERDRLEEYRRTQRELDPDFEVVDDAGEDLLRIARHSHPFEANARVVGVDLTSRPDSRAAADRATLSDRPVLSNVTAIVQLDHDEPGAVLHAPVPPRPGRPQATMGMVFSGQRFVESLEPRPEQVAIRVVDPHSRAYAEQGEAVVAWIGNFDPGAALVSRADVAHGTQRWRVEASASTGFTPPWYQRASAALVLGGSIAALLIGLLVHNLVARQRITAGLVAQRTLELSAVNDRLGLSNEALATANLAKDEFLASVSHELRTPLTVVAGFVESLQRIPSPEVDLAPFLDPIQRNVRRLDNLVADLLTLVSLDAGAVTPFRRPVDLAIVLADAPRVLAGLEDDVEVTVGADCVVEVDPRHLDRILVNLLVNAQRHGTGPLHLRADAVSGGIVELRVRDHGPGVDPEQADAVFERFARGTGTDHVAGTGLGLSIVRELAEINGGAVRYEDADPGACFVVSLVRADPGPRA